MDSIEDPIAATLSTLAVAGDGLFSTVQAQAAGVHQVVLRRAVRRGALVQVRRGWYTTASSRRSPERWHTLRVQAELASRSAGLIVTHDSAAVLHGLPTRRDRLHTVHLGRIGSGPCRHSCGSGGPSCIVHRIPAEAGHDGHLVEPAFAVVQLGLGAGARETLVAADAALAGDLVSRQDLERAVAAYRHTPGVAAVRLAVERADPRAESPGESRLRFVLIALGYPVELQVPVMAQGACYRADLRISGSPVLVEYDGLGKYDDPEELGRERSREAALRAEGWDVVRFDHWDLDRPRLVKQRIDAALARWPGHRAGT
jgi:very-short-patch-repair endonuclease